uniref:Uncharacterized protein n=1 Tax=Oryza nivara TaxID=4536 RepID=A0A0E0HB81_ORYNI
MVDETYFTIQAELEAQFKEVWAKIDWSGIETADWDDFNGPNCMGSLRSQPQVSWWTRLTDLGYKLLEACHEGLRLDLPKPSDLQDDD